MILILSQIKHRRFVKRDEFRTNCIFCGDNKEHLYVNTTNQVFHCFKCGASGRVMIDDDIRITPYTASPPPTFIDPTEDAIRYLSSRGLTMQEILIFCPKSSPQLPQYVFSFYSRTAIVGRAIVDNVPKYRIYESRGTRLWGVEYLDIRKPIVVVEGLFDLFAVRRTYLNVVAVLGKALSPHVENYLYNYPSRVYLCLDADAHKEQTLLRDRLRRYKENVYCVYLSSGDPWDHRDRLRFDQITQGEEDVYV